MASDGITNKAKHGTCRMCQRSRDTDIHVKAVGEVHHGFATGHIWECRDIEDCDKVAAKKLSKNISGIIKSKIENAMQQGRFREYRVVV